MAEAGGGSALRIWKGVAAALFGVQAIIDVGDAMAIVGAGLHFLITIVAAVIYFLVAQRVGWLISHRMLAGVVYGFLFWAAMNYVIIPLSVIGHPVYVGTKVICFAILTHIIEIGLPTSFIIAWRVSASPAPHDKVRRDEQAV